MKAEIRVNGPLDVPRTLERYRVWGEDPVNRLVDGAFVRAVRVGETWTGFELRWSGSVDAPRLLVSTPGDRRTRALEMAVAEVGRLCGLGVDLEAFYNVAKDDPVLGPLLPRLWGLRPTLSPQPLESLVTSVCAQQITLSFAFTVKARLVHRYGTPVAIGRHTVHAFPDAARLARASVAEVIRALTAVRGFGRWTAEWFLARHLGRGDVCAAGDLAVRRAFEHFFNRGRALDEASVRRRAARWGSHQNLAVHYLLAGRRLPAAA